jgi:hypothetical protein
MAAVVVEMAGIYEEQTNQSDESDIYGELREHARNPLAA